MKKIVWTTLLCVALLLVFSSSGCMLIIGSPTFPARVLFEETFESQDAFLKNWQVGLGTVKVENGKAYMGEGSTKEGATAQERACYLYLMPISGTDFDLEIDFRVIEVNPTLDKSFVAIAVRRVLPTDKYWNSGYTVRFTKGAGEVSLWKVGEKPISIPGKADFSGAPISMRMEARGAKINVYVNGELLIEYEEDPDTAFLQGFFAVFTEATHIEISKYKITEV